MDKAKKSVKIKLSRTPSVSSNAPATPSASAARDDASTPKAFVEEPDLISPTSYFPASAATIASARSSSGLPSLDVTTMPPPAVPPTPTDGKPKIRIKLSSKSQPSTPVSESAPVRTALPARTPLPAKPPPTVPPVAPTTTTKAGRTTKPTAKKRGQDDLETDDDDEDRDEPRPPPKKKLSLVAKHPTVTINTNSARRKSNHKVISLKDKLRSSTAQRSPGSGFDSELEDAETGPITEEEIIFRMMEGPECDYINDCLSNKKFPSGDSMTFKLKWVAERRAAVTVDTTVFAAVLVDLPTITEATKTWDKKLVVKSADICQMLLVFAKITREDEAITAPLPKVLFDGFRWPHGLTPPMHDAVHRRFRKRLHKNDILNKEQEVNRLLEADKKAISTRYEYIGERRDTLQMDTPGGEMLDADGEEDAEGEYESTGFADDHDLTLEAELERELDMSPDQDAGIDSHEAIGTPGEAGVTPGGPPAEGVEATEVQGDDDDLFGGDGESGEDDDDDDEDSDDDLDPAERQRRDEVRSVREEVKDMDKKIKKLEEQLLGQTNPLLKNRLVNQIKGVRDDKRLKLASIGDVPSEDEED